MGIQSHYGGLWVQGTASPPPSTTGNCGYESSKSYDSDDSYGNGQGQGACGMNGNWTGNTGGI